MKKVEKVLFINQEISPYVPDTSFSLIGRRTPQTIQEAGLQVRTFMPRWGCINERRNQLHEVIRLSGMNIIIDDSDHTLVIKVASIPSVRMQVYFIDNDDYFHRSGMMGAEDGKDYADNAERAVFFARGVLETIKKSHWNPDVIHCHGWISALAPLYIRTAYKDEPAFADSKIVFSVPNDTPHIPLPKNLRDILMFRDANAETIAAKGVDIAAKNIVAQLAMAYSDGFVQINERGGLKTMELAREIGLKILTVADQVNMAESYREFYESLWQEDAED